MPASITELQHRVQSAQKHIDSVEEKERERRLSGSIQIAREQGQLSPEQASLLKEISLVQDNSHAVKEAG